MLFCHIKVAPFADGKVRYIDIYFPKNFITTAKHEVKVEAIKYLGKYMTIYQILACVRERSNLFVTQ